MGSMIIIALSHHELKKMEQKKNESLRPLLNKKDRYKKKSTYKVYKNKYIKIYNGEKES